MNEEEQSSASASINNLARFTATPVLRALANNPCC